MPCFRIGNSGAFSLPAWSVISPYTFFFWLPQYLIDVRGFDLSAIALFAWLPRVAADLGALVGGMMSSSLVTQGHSIDRARKTVIWLGAVLVAPAVVPAYYTESSALALALIYFGLYAIQIKGGVFFKLPTDLFPADRVATVWGVFAAVGRLGGSLLGLLAGFMIEEAGYESVCLLIASSHLISPMLLQIFVPKITLVTD